MTPRRVVVLNDRCSAQGGATSLALLSARLLCEAGLEVVYVTGDDGIDAELPAEVEIIALGGRQLLELPFFERTAKGFYNREARDLVAGVVERYSSRDTVFHIHGWAQIFSPSVFGPLATVDHRLAIHAHDFFHACPNGTYFNFRTGNVCGEKPLGARCLATNCDKRSFAQKTFRTSRMVLKQQIMSLARTRAVLAMIHPYMAEWLERAGIAPGRLRVVRNPVKAFTTQRVHAERNSEVVFIGRIEHEKGADLAVRAAMLSGRRIRVIGDGSERARLQALYPEAVWEGWAPHARISELITGARALIMPSRLPEPFGLVALEALQSGVPLVAFPDSFIGREAAGLGCAFLAADRRESSLADAVRALDDDAVVEGASRTAFRVSHTLSTTHAGWRDELLELYGEILAVEAQSKGATVGYTSAIANASRAIVP